ncbi:MAG: nitrile hydratase beta subunit [Candidatus Poriferisodalaceae bacterium]|jgi:nitrile hydratase beta subunit
MAAVHDLGGDDGYGRVPHDPDEPPFHDDWERHVFAMLGPALAGTVPGEFRHALERLSESDYFGNGYYGRWLSAFELVLTEHGVLAPGEIDQLLGADVDTGPVSRAAEAVAPDPSTLPADRPVLAAAKRSVRRVISAGPRFKVGESVSVIGPTGPGHTRVPAYIDGKAGVVAAIHPVEVLPDSTAHGLGERPQWVLAVAFDAVELWGAEAEPGVTIHVDVYENHLRH